MPDFVDWNKKPFQRIPFHHVFETDFGVVRPGLKPDKVHVLGANGRKGFDTWLYKFFERGKDTEVVQLEAAHTAQIAWGALRDEPVLAFPSPLTSFPCKPSARAFQKHLRWSHHLARRAKATQPRAPYVALHLRRGSDWVKGVQAEKPLLLIQSMPSC